MPKSTPWTSRPIPTSRKYWTSWKPSARSGGIHETWLWQPPVPARPSFQRWTTNAFASRTLANLVVCSLWHTEKKFSGRACTPSAPYSRMPTLVKCSWATISPRALTTCLSPSRPSTHRTSPQKLPQSSMISSLWTSFTMQPLRPTKNCWPIISPASCWA